MEQQPPAVVYTSDDRAQPELTNASQSSLSHPLITSPAFDATVIQDSTTLSFPTLSPDGSIDDLSSTPNLPLTETPPAALSSLARKAKMPRTSMSDSTSSLDEGQYDMLDDASDFSNDDRETASLASTRRDDGQMTPDGSVVDPEEDRDDMESSTTIQGSFETVPAPVCKRSESQTRAENDLLDSYMTDDLETPRQSLMPGQGFEQSKLRHTTKDSHTTTLKRPSTGHKNPIRVLFVSEHGVNDIEIADVCQHLASCLAANNGAVDTPKAVRLPSPPSGDKQPSALYVVAGDTELIVKRMPGIDTENASYAEIEAPNLVVYYITPGNGYPTSFVNVQNATYGCTVASMTLGAPGFDFDDLTSLERTLACSSDLVLRNKELFDGDGEDLGLALQILLGPTSTPTSQGKSPGVFDGIKKQWMRTSYAPLSSVIIAVLALKLLGLFYFLVPIVSRTNPAVELSVRRAALSNALIEVTNSTDAIKIFNIEHLVPQNSTSTYDVFYQGRSPNHIVLTIPKTTNDRGYSTPTGWKVYRKDVGDVAYNLTKLIDGIYHISVSPRDAYGTICAEVATKNPNTNGTSCHNFGNRMLQRLTYEKASKELSKAVNKDVAVASQRVKAFKEKLGSELTAGAVATKNVTTQLAVYVARDLQIFAHTAVSVFEKLGHESQGAMGRLNDRIRRDAHNGMAQAEIGFHKLQEGVQKSLQTTSQFTKDLIPTKKQVGQSLFGARQRALKFKNRLSGLKKDTNSTSATKELSLRFQKFFKPSEKNKRAGSLRDIASCLRAEDYQACRREQRKKAKAISAYKPPSALAKLPEPDVLKKAVKESKAMKENNVVKEGVFTIPPHPRKPSKLKLDDLKSVPKLTEVKSKRGARKMGKKAR